MGEINWRDSWDSALEEAKKVNRRILLELYMDGCPHCMRLHSETHADAGVVQALNSQYVPVRLEGRSHMDVVKKFNVTGAPTTLVLSRGRQRTAPVSRLLCAGGLPETTGKVGLIPSCAPKDHSPLEGASYAPSMARETRPTNATRRNRHPGRHPRLIHLSGGFPVPSRLFSFAKGGIFL